MGTFPEIISQDGRQAGKERGEKTSQAQGQQIPELAPRRWECVGLGWSAPVSPVRREELAEKRWASRSLGRAFTAAGLGTGGQQDEGGELELRGGNNVCKARLAHHHHAFIVNGTVAFLGKRECLWSYHSASAVLQVP